MFGTLASLAALAALVVVSTAMWLYLRKGHLRKAASQPSEDPTSPEVHIGTFDEPALAEVERAFEILLARGSIIGERATTESHARARVPEYAGPVFRALAKRFVSLEMPEVDVKISLHAGDAPDDAIGGWRLSAEPPEIDIRLAPPSGAVPNPQGDVILDATWSPRSSAEVAAHSTLLHFMVRAVCGDRVPNA